MGVIREDQNPFIHTLQKWWVTSIPIMCLSPCTKRIRFHISGALIYKHTIIIHLLVSLMLHYYTQVIGVEEVACHCP